MTIIIIIVIIIIIIITIILIMLFGGGGGTYNVTWETRVKSPPPLRLRIFEMCLSLFCMPDGHLFQGYEI
jgi:amino acid transporter